MVFCRVVNDKNQCFWRIVVEVWDVWREKLISFAILITYLLFGISSFYCEFVKVSRCDVCEILLRLQVRNGKFWNSKMMVWSFQVSAFQFFILKDLSLLITSSEFGQVLVCFRPFWSDWTPWFLSALGWSGMRSTKWNKVNVKQKCEILWCFSVPETNYWNVVLFVFKMLYF